MLKVNTYSSAGTKKEDFSLPKDFDQKANLNLLAQAVHVYQERGHIGLRHTKTRSEVARTTKKVYKQKGTGGARHGSRRANLFVGGGIIFGPRVERRILTISKVLGKKAKNAAFGYKAGLKEAVIVTDLSKVDQTKKMSILLNKLMSEVKAVSAIVVLSDSNKSVGKYIRNLSNVKYVSYKDVNAFDILKSGLVVLDETVFEKEKVKVKTAKK